MTSCGINEDLTQSEVQMKACPSDLTEGLCNQG